MKIHVCTPFSLEKNLGKAYNEQMSLVGENDWCCFHDYDITFLLPDSIPIMYEYVKRNPDAGILTCYTNRISKLSVPQLLGGKISSDTNIENHIKFAERQKAQLYSVTPITRDISGFLMLISKKTWEDLKFTEDTLCLRVDTIYNRRLREKGKSILRMNGLYVFHIYRMLTGIKNKTHLLNTVA